MHHHHMHTLTNEDALRSASRSAAAPTGEKVVRDTNDNSGTILEVDDMADDSVSGPRVGAHGSYSFSMHVLTLPPICVLKEAKELPDNLRQWLGPPNPLNDHVDAHHGAGKCQWFIQSKTFRWWKKKEKGASLLICGESVFL